MDPEHRRLILRWRWRWPAATIAAGLGIPELMVHIAWREDGRPKRNKARPPRHRARWTKEDLAYALAAWRQGLPLADIARRLGRRPHIVMRRIKAAGAKRDPAQNGRKVRLAYERRNVRMF